MIEGYPLRVGATKMPFGQFYGGLVGWHGLPALYRYPTDKKERPGHRSTSPSLVAAARPGDCGSQDRGVRD